MSPGVQHQGRVRGPPSRRPPHPLMLPTVVLSCHIQLLKMAGAAKLRDNNTNYEGEEEGSGEDLGSFVGKFARFAAMLAPPWSQPQQSLNLPTPWRSSPKSWKAFAHYWHG